MEGHRNCLKDLYEYRTDGESLDSVARGITLVSNN